MQYHRTEHAIQEWHAALRNKDGTRQEASQKASVLEMGLLGIDGGHTL